jgi:hypothetical protein
MALTIVLGLMIFLPLVVGSYMHYALGITSGMDIAATILLYVVEMASFYSVMVKRPQK